MRVITYERCMALVCVLGIVHFIWLSDLQAEWRVFAGALLAVTLMYWLFAPAWYSMAEQCEEQEA